MENRRNGEKASEKLNLEMNKTNETSQKDQRNQTTKETG